MRDTALIMHMPAELDLEEPSTISRGAFRIEWPRINQFVLRAGVLHPGTGNGDLAILAKGGAGNTGLVVLLANASLHLPHDLATPIHGEDSVCSHLDQSWLAVGDGFGKDGKDAALAPEEAGGEDVPRSERGGNKFVELVEDGSD
eukprot:CAMPEP_0178710842 /NCGR_PEP_ID=MMETSP0699-20121125/18002_1 /TAXON_ID=265572 /ORGANISM="Extubocellulus spinifer, Strain CCMP396" /LENGTH=144 /DNA_ID=CAMNT_0020359429 /DNA_START=784 /DNA_END=1218 /DNA_ORIENTATION=-